MTLNQPAHPTASNHTAPVLPADKARASELFQQVKGTDREQDYRRISQQHPDKDANRATYLAFLDDIEAMFVDPQADQDTVPDFHPNVMTQANADADERDEGEEADEPSEADVDPGDQASGELLPSAAGLAQTAILPVAGNGLISQLAGMLADGGQLSFTMMCLGDEVTLSIRPKPHGTETVVPLLLTNTPGYLDTHLVSAMQPYVEVRRDIYAQCTAAAKAQRKAGEKAVIPPTPAKAGTAKPSATVQLTLDGMEGTTFTATHGRKSVDVTLGTQAVPKGTITVNARHALYGEHVKTFMLNADRTHDFREQQGAAITLAVTPDSAAITATQGEQRVALHGEGFLAPGKWLIEAEAAGHSPQSKSITVVAAKPQTVTLTLPEEREQSLF
ncbi:PRTRC system protein E [Deinococcus ruber]|nr:PRTRC system protein E [Deinococcus ruber]